MSQLTLSTDLKVLTAEILLHKETAGRSIFEIGARLKHVKDNNLAHGQWERWCEDSLNISARQARKYIRVFERFANRKLTSDSVEKLDMLTAFDDEELETPVQLQSGETKKPIEMTNKEIEQYKQQLKSEQDRATKAENEARHWQGVAKSAQNQPTRVVTQTVEVVPDHIKKQMEEKEFQISQLRHGYQNAKEKLQQYELQNTVDFDAEQARKQRAKLQHEADYNVLELRVHIRDFMERAAITTFMEHAITAADPITKQKLMESIEILEQFTNQIKTALRGRKLGGVINE